MKAANFFAIYMLSVLMVFMLIGCSKKDGNVNTSSADDSAVEYKDGEYKAAANGFDDNGYKSTVTVVIKDGNIQSVFCDADKKGGGTKKADSENGLYDMKKGGSQYAWHEEVAFFEQYVRENGVGNLPIYENGKTDAITGCTIAVSEYVGLINEALKKAEK